VASFDDIHPEQERLYENVLREVDFIIRGCSYKLTAESRLRIDGAQPCDKLTLHEMTILIG